MKKINLIKKSGFSILAVILVIVAVVVAVGVWAVSGESNVSNTSKLSTDIAIEGMLNDVNVLKGSIQEYTLKNGTTKPLDLTDFTFDRMKVNSKILRVGATANEGRVVINSSAFFGSLIGQPSNPDTTILVGGLTDVACKKINQKIYGIDTIPTTTPTSATSSSFVSASTKGFSFNDILLDSFTGVGGWDKGCFNIRGLADNNVFFMIAIAQ